MPLGLNMQINLVVCSLIGGVITGILFDIYRGIRGLNSIKNINNNRRYAILRTYCFDCVYLFIIY